MDELEEFREEGVSGNSFWFPMAIVNAPRFLATSENNQDTFMGNRLIWRAKLSLTVLIVNICVVGGHFLFNLL